MTKGDTDLKHKNFDLFLYVEYTNLLFPINFIYIKLLIMNNQYLQR